MFGCLAANKLSLNVEKSHFVIFHPPQKKVTMNIELSIGTKFLKPESCVKYLGIYLDCNLNWKHHINAISKKISRNNRVLSKIRHFVSSNILTMLYFSLIYPFLTYGLIVWGNTYHSSLSHSRNPFVL